MFNCSQNGLSEISFQFSSQKAEFQQLFSTPFPSFLESFSSHPTLHYHSLMLVINLKFYASGREWLVSWPDCTFVLHIFIPSFLSVILPLHSLLIQFSKYSFNLGTIPHPQCTKALVCLYLATRSFDVLCTALYLLNFLLYLQTLLIKVLAFH